MDRDGLANFLRRRRDALEPGDVGLHPGQRRRTGGLRREEVAALAHMSTDFYARLEQRRGSRPSERTVAALARAVASLRAVHGRVPPDPEAHDLVDQNVTERLVVFTAAPDSEDAQRLQLLSVVGSQHFSGAGELAS
jgi:hypothetical protein